MKYTNRMDVYLLDISIVIGCMLLSYWTHIHAFMNWDVAWHVEGARRLLRGGNYLVNVFDNNSPFVFAYFFPIHWLHPLFRLSYPELINAYITATAIVPLTLGYYLIKETFISKSVAVRRLLYYALVYLLLFLPAFHYGHREVTLMYFYLPYFLLVMLSTTYPTLPLRKPSLNYLLAILGAFGMLQNLFYLSIPLLLDVYSLLKGKKFALFQGVFYAGIALAVGLVFHLYPEYIRHIIPMVFIYESGFNFPLLALLLEVLTFISLLTLALALANYRIVCKDGGLVSCCIAAACSLLIYFFELKLWYYHLYPALGFVVLTLILLIAKYYEQRNTNNCLLPKLNVFTISLAIAILATITLTMINFYRDEFNIYHNSKDEKNRWLYFAGKNFAHKKVYFLVIQLGPAYSLPFYGNANIEVVSPWSNPWLLPYIIMHQPITGKSQPLAQDINIFQNLATAALVKHQPDFIITEDAPATLLYQGRQFNYFSFFSHNKQFANFIKNYQLFCKFDHYTIYKNRKTH